MRETKEQRKEREAREEAANQAKRAEFLKGIADRFMNAMALAKQVGVFTTIDMVKSGPSIHFHDDAETIDETLTYESEEWEVEFLERHLKAMKEKQDATYVSLDFEVAFYKEWMNQKWDTTPFLEWVKRERTQ